MNRGWGATVESVAAGCVCRYWPWRIFGDEVKDHCDKTLAGSAFRHLDLPELCEIVQFN